VPSEPESGPVGGGAEFREPVSVAAAEFELSGGSEFAIV